MMKTAWMWSIGALVLCALLSGCMAEGDAVTPSTGGGPLDPPLPRTGSIMPLDAGTEWHYHHVVRDTLGEIVDRNPHLDAAIGRTYGVTLSGDVVRYTHENRDGIFTEYYSEFEWEAAGSGSLLSYRDTHLNGSAPGVYLMGEFQGDSLTIYASPHLLLAYPADEGFSWTFEQDSVNVTMTLVSTDTTIHLMVTDGVESLLPITFAPCSLYRRETPSETSYHFYHKDYGEVACQRYVQRRLVRSYILTSFSPWR